MLRRVGFILLLSCVWGANISAEPIKEIAITIDDLPFVGAASKTPGDVRRTKDRFHSLLNHLNEYKIPATGFVIAGSIGKNEDLLQEFHDSGYVIGNHTYSHLNLGTTNTAKYIHDVEKADQRLIPLMDGVKYFRYPYLAESKGIKKQEIYDFLAQNNYVIAPVTVDSKDYRFNSQLLGINWRNRMQHLPSIKKRYLEYIWQQTIRAERNYADQPQILLIHANLLNSEALGDIIYMYQEKGYKIISLEEALRKKEEIAAAKNNKVTEEELAPSVIKSFVKN